MKPASLSFSFRRHGPCVCRFSRTQFKCKRMVYHLASLNAYVNATEYSKKIQCTGFAKDKWKVTAMNNVQIFTESTADGMPGNLIFDINTDLLLRVMTDSVLDDDSSGLYLTLPGGEVVSLTTVSMEENQNGYAWHGAVKENPDIYAFMGVATDDTGSYVSGSLYMGDRSHAIEPVGANQVNIFPSLPGINKGRRPPVVQIPASMEVGSFIPSQTSDVVSDLEVSDVAAIEILALYNAETEKAIKGGSTGIKAVINKMQSYVNNCFTNSGIPARVNISISQLDMLKEVYVDLASLEVAQFTDGFTQKKPAVKGPAYQLVSELRDERKADIVMIMVPKVGTDTSWGIASCIPQPARASCSDLEYAVLSLCIKLSFAEEIFAHELGHLLGGQHAGGSGSSAVPIYAFAQGYEDPDSEYGTAMTSRVTLPTVLPAYSSADRTYNGKRIGTAISQPGAADCASLFRLTVHEVSRYRSHQIPSGQSLTIEIIPPSGGFLAPDRPGPFKVGSHVNITAEERPGFLLDYWVFNDVRINEGRTTRITVYNGKNHLKAYFKKG